MDNIIKIKNTVDDVDVIFDVSNSQTPLEKIEEQLEDNQDLLDAVKKKLDEYSFQGDKWDYLLAFSSGIIGGVIDALMTSKFSFTSAQTWGTKEIEGAVINIAKRQGCRKEDLTSCVTFLEENNVIAADKATNAMGGGLQHHLRDFSHHFSFSGLFFSLLTQFSGKVYGSDVAGNFTSVALSKEDSYLIGSSFEEKIFFGVVKWFFHMASDMAGSSNSTRAGKAGSGIPGPMLSFVKVLSSSPLFGKENSDQRVKVSKTISQLFNGTLYQENGVPIKYDLRTELGLAKQQALKNIPVIINEIVVRAFYFIRRLLDELKIHHNVKDIDWKKVLPFNNATITRMMLISSGTLMSVDLIACAIKSAKNSGGNKYVFLANFVLTINYGAVFSFSCYLGKEIYFAFHRYKQLNEVIRLNNERMSLLNAKTYYKLNETWEVVEEVDKSIKELSLMINNVSLLLSNSLKQNEEDVNKIGTYKEGIDKNNPDLNNEILDILKW